MNGTTTCDKISCGRTMYNNEARTLSMSSGKTYVLCPDCARTVDRFIVERRGDMIQSSMQLNEWHRMVKEKASRYAEERFMSMGFPKMLELPWVMA